MRTSRVTASASFTVMPVTPLFQLGGTLQLLQLVVPELGQENPQLGEPFRASPVQAARALAALADQPAVTQHLEMLRDGRPGDLAEVRRDLARGQLGMAEQTQDLAPVRLGEGPETLVH